VAQRFTAAITGLFKMAALAAEGECGAPSEAKSVFLNLSSSAVPEKLWIYATL
jgi:hypothetical protein